MSDNSKFTNGANNRVRWVRFERGLSQEKAAALIGFNAQYFSKVERGEIDGSVEFWRNFKDAFEISDSEIWAVINNYPLPFNKEIKGG